MYIDILILSQVMVSPKHGYEIKKNVLFMLGKPTSINNNYLYPALKKFEQMGWITKSLETQNGRPNRHIYSITEQGKQRFYELLNEFPPDYASNSNEIYNRLAFFNLLEDNTRKQMVDSRIAYLQHNMNSLEDMRQMKGNNDSLPFSPYLYQYSKLLIQTELEYFLQLRATLESHV